MTRSRRETVTFRHPFRIKGIDRQLLAGAYEVITDEELIIYAMREAQSVLARHIERSPQDAEETIALLLEILDRQDVVNATDRLCRGYGLRPIR